jgi:hypothetical protein
MLTFVAAAGPGLVALAGGCFTNSGPRVDSSPGDHGRAEQRLAEARPAEARPADRRLGEPRLEGGVAVKELVDDTFADFFAGTLSESGAKLYVSAKGNVQLIDRLDLNNDGYLDLVFAGGGGWDNPPTLEALIYWGSAAGFSAANRTKLPTLSSVACTVADLDDDGDADLVVSNNHSTGPSGSYSASSYVFWGSPGGLSASSKRSDLPTHGAGTSAVADLNRDGHLDLVFANGCGPPDCPAGGKSVIYWGSATWFSASSKTELPTVGAESVSIADLNKDGFLDLVFTSYSSTVGSYIYWGSATGFSSTNRSELPTQIAYQSTVADLNADGWLDLVFTNHYQGGPPLTNKINSYIYWGSPSGYSTSSRGELPTVGAIGVSAADLNGDGRLDLVFSNFTDGSAFAIDSYVYWGGAGGFSAANRLGLPTVGAFGNLVADFNGDGYPDIVFAPYRDGYNTHLDAFIYWGSASGYSPASRASLPVNDAHYSLTADPGSVYDRKPTQTFTSRVHDTGPGLPAFSALTVGATVPPKTYLKLQLRSGKTPAALAQASYYGPTSTADYYQAWPGTVSINPVHDGDRYVQYRALLSSDFGRTPLLDKVTITYR